MVGSKPGVASIDPYCLAVSTVDGIGPARFRILRSHFGSAKGIWQAKREELAETGLPKDALRNLLKTKETLDPYEYRARIHARGIQVVTDSEESYPPLLAKIPDPPIVLYVRGDVRILSSRCIGVVGTRKMTAYGREVTQRLTADLVACGFTIVSGLAFGVDGQAHATCLENNGRTIAVLGCGVDCIYPKAHESLAQNILAASGSILSEAPLSRWVARGSFPARNRIISGLSQGVLVTEAAHDSGALITARLSLEQGREVFAVPGPITSPLSKGPADLIKMGAKLVYCVEDILEEFGLEAKAQKPRTIPSTAGLTKEEKIIMHCIENEAKEVDMLIRESELPIATVTALLTGMELKGLITMDHGIVDMVR